MWPFDRDAAGRARALRRDARAPRGVRRLRGRRHRATCSSAAQDAIAATVRDRLPFMLGCGITAGVAPLLFVQLLHQRRFYTANLLLGPRWLAVVPALIVGFYALYLAKARSAGGALALARRARVLRVRRVVVERAPRADAGRSRMARVLCRRASRVHGGDDRAAPRRGRRRDGDAVRDGRGVVDRRGGRRAARRRSRWPGAGVSIAGAVWLWRAGFARRGPGARLVRDLLAGAAVIDVGAWLALLRCGERSRARGRDRGGTAALVAAVVVREAPRVALIELQRRQLGRRRSHSRSRSSLGTAAIGGSCADPVVIASRRGGPLRVLDRDFEAAGDACSRVARRRARGRREWLSRCTKSSSSIRGRTRSVRSCATHYLQGEKPGTMTRFDRRARPRRDHIAFRYNDRMFDVTIDFMLVASTAGTKLTQQIDIVPTSLVGRLLQPLIRRVLPKQTVTDLEKLRH